MKSELAERMDCRFLIFLAETEKGAFQKAYSARMFIECTGSSTIITFSTFRRRPNSPAVNLGSLSLRNALPYRRPDDDSRR